MKKTVVIYKSIYGDTKQYAMWIGEALNADVLEVEQAKKADLTAYDVVVYGGGLYAGSIAGADFIVKNSTKLKDKALILFSLGMGEESSREPSLNKFKKSGMEIKHFAFKGKLDYERLSKKHALMMKMLNKMLEKEAKKGTIQPFGKLLLENSENTIDLMEQASIKPLVDYVNEL